VHRRSARSPVSPVVVTVLVILMVGALPIPSRSDAQVTGGGTDVTVKARLTGWIARRDGFHLYRERATVRLAVGVWPALRGERVRARLEWRRAGRRWQVLDVTSTRLNLDSRGLFLVRGLPAGYAFRIRAKVRAGDGHGAARSQWGYFRVL
jgi:hypothetical protein